MTDNRMALVPCEATNEEIEAAHKAMYVDTYTGETAVALGAGIDAARSAAPNGGKVSPYALTCAAEKLCEARLCAGAWGKANETERNAFLFEARAVIAALGLEIEE